jgi:MOSC domain-containing protein YiiM
MKDQSTEQARRKGRLAAINRSDGGVPKSQINEALITETGLAGDRQRNLTLHGDPDRAVLLYSMEAIQALSSEGHPIGPGTAGENLTVADLDWSLVVPGAEILIGDAVRLRITKFAMPCFNIKKSFADEDSSRISPERYPGWSRACARVLSGGVVRVGDAVLLL